MDINNITPDLSQIIDFKGLVFFFLQNLIWEKNFVFNQAKRIGIQILATDDQ